MKANVLEITRNWKDNFTTEDMKRLAKMPSENFVEIIQLGNIDDQVAVSYPPSAHDVIVPFLEQNHGNMYKDCDKIDGTYWDGKEFHGLIKGEIVPYVYLEEDEE